MATLIRPEISKKSEYYLPKHRYLELQHYCMQYHDWKRTYNDLISYVPSGSIVKVSNEHSYRPYKSTIRMNYLEKINQLEDTAKETDTVLADYILKAVTENKPYTYLRQVMNIPCGKDYYYSRYRKFFWILDKKRN